MPNHLLFHSVSFCYSTWPSVQQIIFLNVALETSLEMFLPEHMLSTWRYSYWGFFFNVLSTRLSVQYRVSPFIPSSHIPMWWFHTIVSALILIMHYKLKPSQMSFSVIFVHIWIKAAIALFRKSVTRGVQKYSKCLSNSANLQ